MIWAILLAWLVAAVVAAPLIGRRLAHMNASFDEHVDQAIRITREPSE